MSVRIALRSVVCLLALFLFSTAAFGSFPIRSRNIGGTTHVVLYDVIRYYGLKSHVSGRRITLYGAETEIILTIDSRAAGSMVSCSTWPMHRHCTTTRP